MTDTREQAAGAGEWHLVTQNYKPALRRADGVTTWPLTDLQAEAYLDQERTIAELRGQEEQARLSMAALAGEIADLRTIERDLRAEVESLSISYEALDVDNKAVRAEVERLRQERDTWKSRAKEEAERHFTHCKDAEAELATMRERAARYRLALESAIEKFQRIQNVAMPDTMVMARAGDGEDDARDALTQGGEDDEQ